MPDATPDDCACGRKFNAMINQAWIEPVVNDLGAPHGRGECFWPGLLRHTATLDGDLNLISAY